MSSSRQVGGRLPSERYRTAMEDVPLVTVDVVFLNPDKTSVLLGKRNNPPYEGIFYSFGGRLYKNEDLVEAARRIAKEELGIAFSAEDLTYAGTLNEINDSSIFEGVNYHAVDVYFVCCIDNESITLDTQHSQVKWFPVDDATIHPNVRARIESALVALKSV